jgi:hypothetical protein
MRDSSDCLCGLLVYRLHWSLCRGPILTIPLFTVVDMANFVEAVRALLEQAGVLPLVVEFPKPATPVAA